MNMQLIHSCAFLSMHIHDYIKSFKKSLFDKILSFFINLKFLLYFCQMIKKHLAQGHLQWKNISKSKKS
jgi:hypothetical protein